MEKTWIAELKNIQDSDVINLSDLMYGPNYESFNTYATTKMGALTEGNAIIGPNPFGTVTGVPDEFYKRIAGIDGGVEIEYQNASGGTSRTSNIKEIISMCSVYFNHGYDMSEYIDKANRAKNTEAANTYFWASMKRGLNTESLAWYKWVIKPKADLYLKGESSGVMAYYCTLLFNISHQEQFDLSLRIFNTPKQLEEKGVTDFTDIDVCPSTKYDGYGCMELNKFYYSNHKICINKTQDVSSYVHPKNETDDCSVIGGDVTDFEDKLFHDNGCWINTYSTETSYGPASETGRKLIGKKSGESEGPDKGTTKPPLETPTEGGTGTKPGLGGGSGSGKPSLGGGSVVGGDSRLYPTAYASPDSMTIYRNFCSKIRLLCEMNGWGFDGTYSPTVSYVGGTTFKTCVGHSETGTDTYEEKKVIGDEIYLISYSRPIYVTQTITSTWSCQGNHVGYYCGGHLKMDIIGKIYGFTDEQIGEGTAGKIGTVVGKVEDGEYVHKDVDYTVIDTSGIAGMKDIFDADSLIRRPVETPEWEGWTEINMQLAIIKHNGDWEEMYGIVITSSLGGAPLSEAEVEFHMATLETRYPDLSSERKAVIEEALRRVGTIGYSQEHHLCPLDGPCIKGADACKLSDCSGFTSYLWRSRLSGVYSTGSFKSTFNGTSKWSTYGSDTLPGDILLHYPTDGQAHALLYVGKIFADSDNEYVIDCSSLDGVGNVFLRVRADTYYKECYVLKPDK